ncbi:hypothetical protein [Pseudonocardia sp. C8]|uniref:glycosyltransferase family 4 protein n=1 Tax=Pseudonocardia sp. C8 TaxID=2762759 RepID=UPI00351C7CCA
MPVDQLSHGLPIREFLLVGLVTAVVTLLLTGPVRMLALKAGAVAWPRGRDVHVTPTPRWGGLAMFGGILAGLVLSLQLPALRLAYFEGSSEVMGVVLATALLVGVGMLDDRYDLDAITKFAAQVTAGGLLVLYGVQWLMIWIPLGGGGTGISGSLLSLGQSQGVLLTVLLTVGLVNAMNFVDGLDGLAAGIGLITTLATAVFCIGLIRENGNDPAAFAPALIAVVLAGACLGFLPHNFNPARIFMGDTGSMLVGVMLSAAITSASGRLPYSDETSGTDLVALVAPILVVIGIVFIPTLDLLMAVVRRTRAGTSPFSPDKMHLHHRLLQVGHSHRRAVLLAYLWVAVIAFGAVALALVPHTGLVLAATAIALGIAFVASAVPYRSRVRAAAAAASVASSDDVPEPDGPHPSAGGRIRPGGPVDGRGPAPGVPRNDEPGRAPGPGGGGVRRGGGPVPGGSGPRTGASGRGPGVGRGSAPPPVRPGAAANPVAPGPPAARPTGSARPPASASPPASARPSGAASPPGPASPPRSARPPGSTAPSGSASSPGPSSSPGATSPPGSARPPGSAPPPGGPPPRGSSSAGHHGPGSGRAAGPGARNGVPEPARGIRSTGQRNGASDARTGAPGTGAWEPAPDPGARDAVPGRRTGSAGAPGAGRAPDLGRQESPRSPDVGPVEGNGRVPATDGERAESPTVPTSTRSSRPVTDD